MNKQRLLIFVLIAAIKAHILQKEEPNIPKLPVFVGVGYNLISGNPIQNHVDSGFREPINTITYKLNEQTTDGRYLIPDGFTARVVSSCSFTSSVSQYRGTQSYKQQIQKKIDVKAGAETVAWDFSFSASSSYKDLQKQTINEKKSITQAVAECEAYELSLNLFKNWQVDEAFVNAVNSSYSKNSWETFIETYGTHFVHEVIMGGRAAQQITYSYQSMSMLSSQNVDVSIAAKARYGIFFGDISTDWHKYDKEIKYSMLMSNQTVELYVGGYPPKNGDVKAWASNVTNNPMPIRYSVVQIEEVFDKITISPIKDNLTKVKQSFSSYLTIYCQKVGCKKVVPDLPKPPAAKVVVNKTQAVGRNVTQNYDYYIANPFVNVTKFIVLHGSNVFSIRLQLFDGIKYVYSPTYGSAKKKGTTTEWSVPTNEYISQIQFANGSPYLNGFTLITNKGSFKPYEGNKSPRFGSTGKQVMLTFPDDQRLIGIHGYSGDLVDKLGFTLRKTVISKVETENINQKDDIKVQDD